jgi:hypothetical protein
MRKNLQQIVASCEGWETVFFSYKNGEIFRETILCWAFMSDRPYLENVEDEERYLEGVVVINNGSRIGGIDDTPCDIGFLGYLYAKQPRQKIKERMDYFKDQAQQLMKIRKSGHRPGKKIQRTQRGKSQKVKKFR